MSNKHIRSIIPPSISAFITNLGKYNEGELIGKWHEFPTSEEEITQTLEEIGIDGANYEEIFITDYDSYITGLCDCLSEYESIDEINYLALKIFDMNNDEIETFESALQLGDFCNLKDLINLTENLHCYNYLEGVMNNYDLGYYWIEESGCYDTDKMGDLYKYFDYESFGRDISMGENGAFTSKGYIRDNGDLHHEEYDGKNIPIEYKIFALPNKKLSKQL